MKSWQTKQKCLATNACTTFSCFQNSSTGSHLCSPSASASESQGLVTGLCVASQSMVLHVGIMQRHRCWQGSSTPVLCPWVRLENILIISDWQESWLLKTLIVLFLHAFLFNMLIVDKWPLFIAKEATSFWLLIRSKAQQMLRVSLTVSGWK